MTARLKSIYNLLCNTLEPPAIILLYHRVTTLPMDTHMLAVSPGHFYDQIAFLKQKYHLISPEEFVFTIQNRRKFPRGSVLLTFDDGYADNFLEATPILDSLDAQAIFYITTSRLNTNMKLWWDELEEILLNDNSSFPETLKVTIHGSEFVFPTATSAERLATHNQVHPLIKVNSIAERDRIIDDIRKWSGPRSSKNNFHRLLTHSELAAMSRSRACTIGAHTYDHAVLSQLSYGEQVFQIKRSKEDLEKLTGKQIVHFSYPFGTKADYNDASIEICRHLGFQMVCSNYYGHVHSWSDPFRLPRMLVRDWNIDQFANQLRDFFKW